MDATCSKVGQSDEETNSEEVADVHNCHAGQ